MKKKHNHVALDEQYKTPSLQIWVDIFCDDIVTLDT